MTSLSTWVPDYSVWQNITILGTSSGTPYRAAGNTEVTATRHGNTLRIRALHVDSVTSVSQVWNPDEGHGEIFGEWFQFLMARLESTCQADTQRNLRTIARCLIAEVRSSSTESTAAGDGYFENFTACFKHLFSAEPADVQLSNVEANPYMEAFRHVGFGRRIFVSRNGRVGLEYASVEAGDGVYVFSGGRVPFVLRMSLEQSDAFELVGECFLDGGLEGETLNGESRWSTINVV
jgi:hypothetical protein